jgi:hypothetical protein
MSLVTPENVAQKPGWTVTPLGRILRPVKMRPARPLPPATEVRVKKPGEGEVKKKKKRVKDPESRARTRTIDMTRWGSVYLKGNFLDMEVIGAGQYGASGPLSIAADLDDAAGASSDSGSEAESGEADVPAELAQKAEPNPVLQPTPSTSVFNSAPASTQTPQSQALPTTSRTSLLAEEKSHNLTLLASLFGGKTDSDWVGREDLWSDVDEDEMIQKRVFERVKGGEIEDGEEEFEIVPIGSDGDEDLQTEDEEEESPLEPMDVDQEAGVNSKLQPVVSSATNEQQQKKPTKLKDLFAPREEEGIRFISVSKDVR